MIMELLHVKKQHKMNKKGKIALFGILGTLFLVGLGVFCILNIKRILNQANHVLHI